MKKLLLITLVALAGCAYIPSGWDANQSKIATDMQQTTRQLDCTAPDAGLAKLADEIQWFDLYAKAKGTADIAPLSATLLTTVTEFQDRKKKEAVSPFYCELKKKIMIQDADIIAKTVQGRF
jgi:hypothetical protein